MRKSLSTASEVSPCPEFITSHLRTGASVHESIVFIDTGAPFVTETEFAAAAEHSSDCFVIVTRERLGNLPHDSTGIYGLRRSQSRPETGKACNEMYRISGSALDFSQPAPPL